MKPDIKWLDDPEVFRVMQLPAHSDHRIYADKEEMRTGRSSLYQVLDGIWDFHYSRNAEERPVRFYEEGFDDSRFDRIKVPGHIELQGYDKIHYINTMYPWEGKIYRRPACALGEERREEGSFSEAAYNPVGSYRLRFDLKKELCGKRVCICFEGVEEAVYVWMNGHFIGYAEDSFTPSEFELTPFIREKGNLLAVEVHKRSTAAYLEDQDFFRFFGIFRSVELYAKPELHVEDLWIKPHYEEKSGNGSLQAEVKISQEAFRKTTGQAGKAVATLRDKEGTVLFIREKSIENKEEQTLVFTGEQMPVKAWDNENPYLYSLEVCLYDAAGKMTEAVPYDVGFRSIRIENKIIRLNGKRLFIKGVNRHEWSPEGGRCITMEDMEWDIAFLKQNHINAVRTCHYPDRREWYSLCDRAGIYLMAENNLESHGSWQKCGAVEPSWNVPGAVPEWKEAVTDRARTNFECYKNHASVLFWSLGNESYAEENIAAMQRFYKEKDPERPVHYEGVIHNRKWEDDISDVESRMYAYPQEIREYLSNHPKKPFLLCEYMHDMGNSLGGMKSYMELGEEFDMYQGGFIWDYIDQALWVWDEVTGKRVLRYGGDFDDRPSDYEFSGNGILFADRTEKPAVQEVRYYYGSEYGSR